MTSQSAKQTTAIYILTNISRSQGSQAMKFGQSVEHKTRNIFLHKLYAECGGETFPRPFSKDPSHISGSIV